ncbi:MAG: hypothetical protein A2138_15460 [Deltaproteobacteria bacterium RBG_16_71_12]|nr:MAG: hypothetical protein A2138_15460 [Deltaproteobacteria bacterium RBG_16_71_12]
MKVSISRLFSSSPVTPLISLAFSEETLSSKMLPRRFLPWPLPVVPLLMLAPVFTSDCVSCQRLRLEVQVPRHSVKKSHCGNPQLSPYSSVVSSMVPLHAPVSGSSLSPSSATMVAWPPLSDISKGSNGEEASAPMYCVKTRPLATCTTRGAVSAGSV